MSHVGLDIGTNYTKATKDGKNVTMFPSIVAYGEEKDWSLFGSSKEVYIGEEALAVIQTLENVEATRPLHEGRLIHGSYIELAKHALKVLNVKPKVIATGLPVKSSRKEREELSSDIKKTLGVDVFIFPEPVGTLAYMDIDTGVCVDIGFGTTDIVVLSGMEYLKGDTMLVGVDWLYNNIEVSIRNSMGISLTPEEVTKLLVDEEYEVGRIRSGKRITVKNKDIADEYKRLMKTWIDRIISRVKLTLEGLSTTIVDNMVLTGGGALLPGVKETFAEAFKDIAEIKVPDNPITSNALGYFKLAKIIAGSADSADNVDSADIGVGESETKVGENESESGKSESEKKKRKKK